MAKPDHLDSTSKDSGSPAKQRQAGDDTPSRSWKSYFRKSNQNEEEDDANVDKKAAGEPEVRQQKIRGHWSSHRAFLLACIGYTVGFGNIWRFPYLLYADGGAAFLIAYLICLFVAGLPAYYLELLLGQYTGVGPTQLYSRIGPLFKGIGWAMFLLSTILSLKHNVMVSWAGYYFLISFNSPSGVGSCNETWNTEYCLTDRNKVCNEAVRSKYNESNGIFYRRGCYLPNSTAFHRQLHANNNVTKLPTIEFFRNFILAMSPGISNFGQLQWPLVLAQILTWLIVFGCIFRGIRTLGKVAHFTSTIPFIILLIFTIRSLSLHGALSGLGHYFMPNMTKLLEGKVWHDAAAQVCYTLSLGMGGLTVLSSYNYFHNNCLKDALSIVGINVAASFLSAIAVFGVVGNLIHKESLTIGQTLVEGPELAFAIFPFEFSHSTAKNLWGILFFLMLFTIGLGSEFVLVETLLTSLLDEYPRLMHTRSLVTAFVCSSLCLLSMPLCAQNGYFVFQLLDKYAHEWGTLYISIMQFLVVCYAYGIENLKKAVEHMRDDNYNSWRRWIGKFGWYWRVNWMLISPLAFLALLFGSIYRAIVGPTHESDDPTTSFGSIEKLVGVGLLTLSPLYVCLAFAAYATWQAYRNQLPWSWLYTAPDEYDSRAIRELARQLNRIIEAKLQEAQLQDEEEPIEQSFSPPLDPIKEDKKVV